MVAFLMGLQGGFTKFPCYLCHWDSRNNTAHHQRRIWSKRTELSVGKSNVKWDPLINRSKILMPPLKLDLIKQFVKSSNKNSNAFQYLQNFFPKVSVAKIKAGVFIGAQIKKFLGATNFLKN